MTKKEYPKVVYHAEVEKAGADPVVSTQTVDSPEALKELGKGWYESPGEAEEHAAKAGK